MAGRYFTYKSYLNILPVRELVPSILLWDKFGCPDMEIQTKWHNPLNAECQKSIALADEPQRALDQIEDLLTERLNC
jgi:hypothetical protein